MPVDINSNKKTNNKDPKFKIGNIIRISKYKKIFAKGYVLLMILTETKLLECFSKKNC